MARLKLPDLSTLRARLLILVLAGVLPLGALSVWTVAASARVAEAQAQDQLTLAASLVAAHQDRLASSARHLLAVITAVPEIRGLQRETCVDYLARLQGSYPIYANIGIFDLRGDILCHAAARQGGFNAADRDYFQQALARQDFVMGQLVQGRATRRQVLPFGVPILEGGQARAVAFATVDVAEMQREMAALDLPAGVRLLVVDAAGRVLAERDAEDDMPRPPGDPLRAPALRSAAAAMKAGTLVAPDRDGRPRLYAFAPTAPVAGQRLLAVASLDQARITAAARRQALQALAIVAAVLVAGLLAARWLGLRMIAGPAGALAQAARRIGDGELDVRTSLPHHKGAGEFVQLATALDSMAESLQRQRGQIEAELANTRAAHAQLDALNQSLEQRIAQRTADLQRANQELEAFSYSVSHDLRAPLAAVGGFARALAERLQATPQAQDGKVRHYLDRILAGADLMEQSIEALLQLSRLSREPIERQPLDISAMAQDTLEWLRMQAPGRQVDWQVQPGLSASGDARQLRVVLQNLLGNAWKFTARQEAARIEVGVAQRDGVAAFFVRDNGVGFDLAQAQRLFMPFQRMHAAAEFPGTGIGLATVRRVIERHQGRLWVDTASGAGCTVWFTLGPGWSAAPAIG